MIVVNINDSDVFILINTTKTIFIVDVTAIVNKFIDVVAITVVIIVIDFAIILVATAIIIYLVIIINIILLMLLKLNYCLCFY